MLRTCTTKSIRVCACLHVCDNLFTDLRAFYEQFLRQSDIVIGRHVMLIL